MRDAAMKKHCMGRGQLECACRSVPTRSVARRIEGKVIREGQKHRGPSKVDKMKERRVPKGVDTDRSGQRESGHDAPYAMIR